MADRPILHFVYNVDGTAAAILEDFVHRIREPETYPCRLCDVTYGRFFKKAEWSRFVAGLPIRARFHLRNVFARRHPGQASEALPAVFVEEPEGSLRVLISAEEIHAVKDLPGLQELVTKRVEALRPAQPDS